MRLEDRETEQYATADEERDAAIASDVDVHEQADAQAEVARGDIRAVQRRLATLFQGTPTFRTVPPERLHHPSQRP